MEEHYPLRYGNLYVHVTVYEGHLMVHVRERLLSEGGRVSWSRKGLALTPAEWRELVVLAPEVSDALMDDNNVCRSWGLGTRGRRVTVKMYRGVNYVDLRSFWDSTGTGATPRPTRIGVVLTAGAWRRLLTYRLFVEDDLQRMSQQLEATMAEEDAIDRRLEERRRRLEVQTRPGDGPPPPHPEDARVLACKRPYSYAPSGGACGYTPEASTSADRAPTPESQPRWVVVVDSDSGEETEEGEIKEPPKKQPRRD
jgi:hypothetical protein